MPKAEVSTIRPPIETSAGRRGRDVDRLSDLPWRYFLLALISILVFLVCETFIDRLSSSLAVSAVASKSDQTVFAEAAARFKIIGTYILLVFVSVVAVMVFIRDVWLYLAPRAILRLSIAYAACTMVSALFLVWGTSSGHLKETGDVLGVGLFRAAQSYSSKGTNIAILIQSTNYLLPLAAGAVIFGSLIAVAGVRPAETRQSWLQRATRLRTYLYVGAALLVAGVLFHSMWTGWVGIALQATATDKTVKAYGDLVAAYTAVKGIQYSVLIVSYYVPAAWIILQQRPGEAPHGVAAVAKEGSEGQVSHPPWEGLKIIASIMAPLLAGVLGQIAQAVAK